LVRFLPNHLLKYLGFDRVVVGTVTADPWEGNSKSKHGQRIWRYPATKSMVNWLGLPGLGAERVADILYGFGNHGVPITINFMSTPGKQGSELLADLQKTARITKELPFVDAWQLNISCPNTHGSSGQDSRRDYQKQLGAMFGAVEEVIGYVPRLEVKVSPDLDIKRVRDIVDVSSNHSVVSKFVIGNTTTEHDSDYIEFSPGVGGASGDAVYNRSFAVQKMFANEIESRGLPHGLRVCGGIRSAQRARQRVSYGPVKGIEFFTPLIYEGPKLLRELRAA